MNQDEGLLETQDETATTAEEIAADGAEEVEEEVEEEPRTTTRLGRQVVRPSRFAAVTKVSQKQWQEEQARKAIKKELIQLFEELEAIVPIKRQNIPKDATILNSHMFLINKYNADGEFEKVKARFSGRWSRPGSSHVSEQIVPNGGHPFSLYCPRDGSRKTLADCR